MKTSWWMLLPLLAGCQRAKDLEGDWNGTCTFGNDEVDVELGVKDASWGIVEGSVTYEFRDRSWDGTIDGTRSGKDVELSLAVVFGGDYEWRGLFEGELDDGKLDGDMTLSALEFELEGDCSFKD